jgi:hypothetical protein
MRTEIWNQLVNIQFKALYSCECSKLSSFWSRIILFLIAITSASSVAAWAFWQQHTTTWAIIIGSAQIIQLGIPFIPFFKNDKEFLSMSFEFEKLYLEYEKLWYALQDETIKQATARQRFHQLRDKAVEIDRSHKEAHCPEITRWVEKVYAKTESTLKLSFPIRSNNNER